MAVAEETDKLGRAIIIESRAVTEAESQKKIISLAFMAKGVFALGLVYNVIKRRKNGELSFCVSEVCATVLLCKGKVG